MTKTSTAKRTSKSSKSRKYLNKKYLVPAGIALGLTVAGAGAAALARSKKRKGSSTAAGAVGAASKLKKRGKKLVSAQA